MKVLKVLGYDIDDIDDLVQLSRSLFRYLISGDPGCYCHVISFD